jgi:molybdopterin-guanine dinucleotide biosynthesis protein A
MGESKAALDWHGATLLHRTASLLARTLDGPIVVVGAPGQDLPALPPGVELYADPVEGQGPVQGLAVGLAAVADRAALAFVCSVDMPFLQPAFVLRVLAGLSDPPVDQPADPDVGPPFDIALPFARGFRQPLAAAYRTALAESIAKWLAEGVRRPGQVFERCRVRTLDESWLLADLELARLDPDLDSVTNVNDPDDYAEALRRPWPSAKPSPVVLDHERYPTGDELDG